MAKFARLVFVIMLLAATFAAASDTLLVDCPVIEYRVVPGLDGECPVDVDTGWHHLILTSHYRHTWPVGGVMTWSSTTGIWVDGPGVAQAISQGQPMGHEWIMDMALAGACGEAPNPNLLFADGFESGDTSAWQ